MPQIRAVVHHVPGLEFLSHSLDWFHRLVQSFLLDMDRKQLTGVGEGRLNPSSVYAPCVCLDEVGQRRAPTSLAESWTQAY